MESSQLSLTDIQKINFYQRYPKKPKTVLLDEMLSIQMSNLESVDEETEVKSCVFEKLEKLEKSANREQEEEEKFDTSK